MKCVFYSQIAKIIRILRFFASWAPKAQESSQNRWGLTHMYLFSLHPGKHIELGSYLVIKGSSAKKI
jgi:hypothetical protein